MFAHITPEKTKCLCISCASTCSVKGVIGVEDCGEEAERESADAKRHVKAGVTETLEHLCTESKRKGKHRETITSKLRCFIGNWYQSQNISVKNVQNNRTRLTPPRLSGSVLCP